MYSSEKGGIWLPKTDYLYSLSNSAKTTSVIFKSQLYKQFVIHAHRVKAESLNTNSKKNNC